MINSIQIGKEHKILLLLSFIRTDKVKLDFQIIIAKNMSF
jgi:hypothetical protein